MVVQILISPSLSVNSDSTNKVNIKSLGSGKYEITAKAGFTVGNKANLTYTLIDFLALAENGATLEIAIALAERLYVPVFWATTEDLGFESDAIFIPFSYSHRKASYATADAVTSQLSPSYK